MIGLIVLYVIAIAFARLMFFLDVEQRKVDSRPVGSPPVTLSWMHKSPLMGLLCILWPAMIIIFIGYILKPLYRYLTGSFWGVK